MISSINTINDELTKYTISLFKENEMSINELVIQKVIYKVKMDLGPNHIFYDNLPYYWYCYGPFSETVRHSFNKFKKFLKPVGNDFSLKNSYVNDFKYTMIDDFQEIQNLIQNLISKENYVYLSLTEDIYKEFAPLNIIYKFKYGIFNATNNKTFTGDSDEYMKLFEDCLFELYLNNFNQDFNLIFSKFQMQLDLLNEEDQIKKNWNIIRVPIRNLWFTFAQGLRIKAHDNYYNINCKQWNTIFNKSISKLDEDITYFIDKTKNKIDLTRYGELREFDKQFIGSLINIYLEE